MQKINIKAIAIGHERNTHMQRGIAIVLLIMLVLTGCANNKPANNATAGNTQKHKLTAAELTERQKKICEKEGWSLDPSEWKGPQESAVVYSDKCLEYLEETYPEDEFEYLGYTGAGAMGRSSSYMTARSKLAGKRHPVTVTIYSENGGYRFKDDYGPAVESYAYAEEVAKFVKERYPDAEMFYDGTINTKKYEKGETNIITRASGHLELVMEDVFTDGKEVEILLEEIGEWMLDNRPGEDKIVTILVLTKEDMKEATIDNCTKEYQKKNRYVYLYDAYIDAEDGTRITSK